MLPFFLSIPHGGRKIPCELEAYADISPQDLFADMDPFTQEIFDLSLIDGVVTHSFEIARAFIDLNRAPSDTPGIHPDGVVKLQTCYQVPIYRENFSFSDLLISGLLTKYYYPYHRKLQQLDSRFIVALDCHSMAVVGPPQSPDIGKPRPLICLGNADGSAASYELIGKLACAFQNVFGLPAKEVQINKPFSGGYITRTYGNQKLPWIQIELNRRLYLTEEWFDFASLEMDMERIHFLRQQMIETLTCFFSYVK